LFWKDDSQKKNNRIENHHNLQRTQHSYHLNRIGREKQLLHKFTNENIKKKNRSRKLGKGIGE